MKYWVPQSTTYLLRHCRRLKQCCTTFNLASLRCRGYRGMCVIMFELDWLCDGCATIWRTAKYECRFPKWVHYFVIYSLWDSLVYAALELLRVYLCLEVWTVLSDRCATGKTEKKFIIVIRNRAQFFVMVLWLELYTSGNGQL